MGAASLLVLLCAAGWSCSTKWDTYRPDPQAPPGSPPYAITSTAIDDASAGRPTRRFVYGDLGTIARVEVDRAGDGVFVPLDAPPSQAPPPTRGR